MPWLNAEEERLLRFSAARFDESMWDFQTHEVASQLDMTPARFAVCTRRLAAMGAVEIAADVGTDDLLVRVLPGAVDMVRELDHRAAEARAARPDLVEEFRGAVRKNPWTAWPIIVILGLGTVLALANQAWELIDKILR